METTSLCPPPGNSYLNVNPSNSLYGHVVAVKLFLFFSTFGTPCRQTLATVVSILLVFYCVRPCIPQSLFMRCLEVCVLCAPLLKPRLATFSNYLVLYATCFTCVALEVVVDIYLTLDFFLRLCLLYTEQMHLFRNARECVFWVIFFVVHYAVCNFYHLVLCNRFRPLINMYTLLLTYQALSWAYTKI